MSAAEQEQLISHSRSTSNNPSPRDTSNQNTDPNKPQNISPSPSPDSQEIQQASTGLFSKLKSKTRQYSRLAVMNENKPPQTLPFKDTQSAQLPQASKTLKTRTVAPGSLTPTSPDLNDNEQKYDNINIPSPSDKITHDPESPSMNGLDETYTSKDDLDLHTRIAASSSAAMNHPRASAVNPISIPLHASQRQITLDTDFDNNLYGNKSTDNNQSSKPNTASDTNSPASKEGQSEKKSFTKNIVVYVNQDELDTVEEENTSKDMLVTKNVEEVAADIMDDNDKPPFMRPKSRDDDEDMGKVTRVSVQDLFNIKKNKDKDHGSKTPGLDKINESGGDTSNTSKKKKKDKGRKLKKDKSVFDAFKKEKKPDLSNIKNLPISLKTHLNDDSSDHAIQLILDHIRDLDTANKGYIYEQLVKDKEFIPRICNKLLEATDAKHNEIVCIWLYDFFKEENPNARLFALQFIPCLIWCLMTRPAKCVSGVVAALLSLYKKECAIFEKLNYDEMSMIDDLYNGPNDDVSDLLKRDKKDEPQYGVSNQHTIFPKFEMPDLDLPSIYHEPNTTNNNKPTAPKIYNGNRTSQTLKPKANILKQQQKMLKGVKDIKDMVFPSLNQANLSTNLHLIYVALQVFNHYITRVSKPSICLEQMCAVIAKLCSSGIDASQPMRFPDSIKSHFAWDWKWYTEDLKEKQHEKYILPSAIMSQFLNSIRYSLKQPKTRNIAKFALGQIHRRGHIDMIPEVILQTTSMLHTAFMDGLTF